MAADIFGAGQDRQVDEREFSRLVAETYGLERVELLLPQDSLTECLADYAHVMEDLRMGIGYPVYCIARRVARDAKVVLSGTGGDEFHAGYVGRYQNVARAAGLNSAPLGWGPRGLKRRLGRWLRGSQRNAMVQTATTSTRSIRMPQPRWNAPLR